MLQLSERHSFQSFIQELTHIIKKILGSARKKFIIEVHCRSSGKLLRNFKYSSKCILIKYIWFGLCENGHHLEFMFIFDFGFLYILISIGVLVIILVLFTSTSVCAFIYIQNLGYYREYFFDFSC